MSIAKRRSLERSRRAARVRKSISGTTERPRLCVRRSINHIYAQVVDDVLGRTIAQVGSVGKEFAAKTSGKTLNKTEVSKIIGEMIAEKAMEQGVKTVVFDRKGYLYHGRVKALAEAARGKGLVF
ncbi:MAG: 50S ribosomal protein L18 [Chitinispirillales bacterium]|jgi:large subunit ribosomal protein L18|nr:50S ribosomal protein L18 [Chitinispirillales bacterium]